MEHPTVEQYLETMDALEVTRKHLVELRSKMSTFPVGITHVLVAYHNIINAANAVMDSAAYDGIDLEAAYHERETREALQAELIF